MYQSYRSEATHPQTKGKFLYLSAEVSLNLLQQSWNPLCVRRMPAVANVLSICTGQVYNNVQVNCRSQKDSAFKRIFCSVRHNIFLSYNNFSTTHNVCQNKLNL